MPSLGASTQARGRKQELLWLYRRSRWLLLGLGLASCSAGADLGQRVPQKAPVMHQGPLLGSDGAVTVTAPDTVLNRYAALKLDAKAGAQQLTVDKLADLAPVAAGDVLLVLQAQGAVIDGSDTASFGSITDYGSAGRYEFVTVASVDATSGTIFIDGGCGGLRFDYTAAGHTQVVRVPQLATLTIEAGGSVTALAWDGRVGGVAAVVADSISATGDLDVSGKGFRGGGADNTSSAPIGTDVAGYRSTQPALGAEKGEGIAGAAADYQATAGGRYGRGAAANGGGGGNAHNAGGGGGAGGSNGQPYGGQGVMEAAAVGAAQAWPLDPEYVAAGNKLTNSSGGGRGGYSASTVSRDPQVTPPGDALWSGNQRRERGGRGGRPLTAGMGDRLFMGGGGGAGDGNNSASSSGGSGGGVLFVLARSLTGSGKLLADGAAGGDTQGSNDDAASGGGGGGTIVLAAQTASGVALSAAGGRGGKQGALVSATEAEGPGGGGGGGLLVLPTGVSLTSSVAGGPAGLSDAPVVKAKFPVNGATAGGGGQVLTSALLQAVGEGGAVPGVLCVGSAADVAVSIGDSLAGGAVAAGSSVQFAVSVTNLGPGALTGVALTDQLLSGGAVTSWTCSAQGGASCPAASGAGSLTTAGLSLPAGGSATYLVTAQAPAAASGALAYRVDARLPSGYYDPNPGDNSAVASHPVAAAGAVGSADLSLQLTHEPQPVLPLTEVLVTASVRNAGPQAASGGQVALGLPSGLQVLSVDGGASWNCTVVGSQVLCSAAMLAVGQAAPIGVRAVASAVPKSGGRLAVQGAVSAAGPSDPVSQNNRAIDWLGGPASDVAVRLRREPEVAAAGSSATYTVQVSNTGPDVAGVVGVSLVLPTGAVVQQAPSGSGWQCAGNAGVFTCSRSTLALGDAPPLSAQLTIPGTASEHLFAAVAAAPSVDPNLANNRASFEVPRFSVTDLQLTLTRQPGAAGLGQPAQYVVQVANLGAGTVTAPTVVVRLPVGSTISAPAQGSGWSFIQAAQALSCSRSVLVPGQAPPLTVGIYTPVPATSSTLAPAGVLSALVSAEQSTDPRTENNFAALELGTTAATASDLSLQLARSPELSRPGDEVTYQLQPMSSGPGLVYGATVAVVLPPQTLVTQPAAGSGWDCVAGLGAYLCTLDAPAAPGLLPPLSLKLLTPDVSQSGDPQLQASLSAAQNVNDPQPDNNTVRSSLSGALLKLAGGGFSCTAAAGPGVTRPGWLLLLSALVGGGQWLRVRRRQRAQGRY